MIQFQQAPTTAKSDSLVDLIKAKRIEELDQVQAEHRRREEERYSLEKNLKVEEFKLDDSRRFVQQATFVGLNLAGFGVIAFLLRTVFLNAGYIPAGGFITVVGSISLALSVPLIIVASLGWRELWQGNKRVRALKDTLKGNVSDPVSASAAG